METVVALFDSFPEFPFAGVGVDAAQSALDLRKKIEASRPEVADILPLNGKCVGIYIAELKGPPPKSGADFSAMRDSRQAWVTAYDRLVAAVDFDGNVNIFSGTERPVERSVCRQVFDLASMPAIQRGALASSHPNFRGAIFRGASAVNGPDFIDLRGADLRGAVFQGGLTPALRLDGADLRCADLGEVSAELLERVAPGAKLDGARTQLVRPTATCRVKVSYRGSPNGGRITWNGNWISGSRPVAKVGARPFPDDDCTSFGSRYARWAGIVLGSPRPLGLGEARVGYATPAKIAALVEGQLTFERLACHLALRVPGSGGFRSAPRFSMSDVLRFVSDSIIETMERLGEKPGPVDEDRDFL